MLGSFSRDKGRFATTHVLSLKEPTLSCNQVPILGPGKAQTSTIRSRDPTQAVCPIHGAHLFLRHGWECTNSRVTPGSQIHLSRRAFAAKVWKLGAPGPDSGTWESTNFNVSVSRSHSSRVPHPCRAFVFAPWVGNHKLPGHDVTISLKSAIPENSRNTRSISPKCAPRVAGSGSSTITLSKNVSTAGRSVAISASASP
jgi:hypothetical protein